MTVLRKTRACIKHWSPKFACKRVKIPAGKHCRSAGMRSFSDATHTERITCEGTNSAASAFRGFSAGRASRGTVIRSARRPLCISSSALALHVTHFRVCFGNAGLRFEPRDTLCRGCGKASRPARRDPEVHAMFTGWCPDIMFLDVCNTGNRIWVPSIHAKIKSTTSGLEKGRTQPCSR